MNKTARKIQAFALLREGLTPFVQKTLQEEFGEEWKQSSVLAQASVHSSEAIAALAVSNPLQVIMILWAPVFSKNSSLNLDHVRHLHTMQRQNMDNDQLSVTIDMMFKVLLDVGAFVQMVQVQVLKPKAHSSSGGRSILNAEALALAGGVAVAGGVATAGFLVYKGITSLMNRMKIEEDNSCPDPGEEEEESVSQAVGEGAESPFICPITLQIMRDPVITPQGICFERQAILDWIEKKHTCPITHEPLTADRLITCYTLKNAIADYERMQESLASSSSSVIVPPPTTKKLLRIEVAHAIADRVKVWGATKICSEDRCPHFPERKKFLVFPASTNYVFDRCTGFICIENRGDSDVVLISRQRGATVWEPFNEGGRVAGTYTLRAHTRQGFDFRGFYCIEVNNTQDPIDLLVYDYSPQGGGKGNYLSMYP